jgi:hypothetical protein
MFVVDAGEFNERDRWQSVVLQVRQELRFILQMCVWACGLGIQRWRGRIVSARSVEERRVFGEVGEWLMMKLEDDIRIVGRLGIVLQCRVPTAGIPFPANPRVIKPVANRDHVAGL